MDEICELLQEALRLFEEQPEGWRPLVSRLVKKARRVTRPPAVGQSPSQAYGLALLDQIPPLGVLDARLDHSHDVKGTITTIVAHLCSENPPPL